MKDNYITDPAVLEEIFAKMPNLIYLQCAGNAFRDKITDFRKTVIVSLPKLQYLDDRPVTEDDRRRAVAFAEGRFPAERVVIKQIKEEKKEKQDQDIKEFDEYIDMYTEDKKNQALKK